MKTPRSLLLGWIVLSHFVGLYTQATESEDIVYWMKIKAADKYVRSAIADTGVVIESVVDDYVYAEGRIEELQEVKKIASIEVQFPLTDMMDFPSKDEKFHNYSELTAKLQELVQKHSHIAQMKSIGKSVEGRDIWVIRMSGQLEIADQLPAAIFMGGHHSREHLSVELPLAYIEYLLTEYDNGNPRVTRLMNGRDVHIIPAVNPDGLEYDVSTGSYKMWRKNRRKNSDGTMGVDLNRNYGFKWGTGGSSNSGSSDVYMGPQPFSEPETQAIKNYIEFHNNITVLLSFHTFSELVLYPWGHKYDGIDVARDKQVFETMAKQMGQWNGYTPQQSSQLYIASGDTTDWAYGEHKIISFTFELDPKNQWSGGFYPGQGVIPSVVQKNLEPVLYLIDYSDNPYRVLNNDIIRP